jgi:hypothetical protein
MSLDQTNMEKPITFLGVRGTKLKAAMVGLVVMPSFLLFGYNNGSVGPITALDSFAKVLPLSCCADPPLTAQQFPTIDVVTTTGDEKSHNALILGVWQHCFGKKELTRSRHRRCML